MLDLEFALNSLGGERKIFRLLAESFINNYQDFIEDLDNAKECNNLEQLHYLIHTLKGFTKNLGMIQLHDASVEILGDIMAHKIDNSMYSEFKKVFTKSYLEVKKIITS